MKYLLFVSPEDYEMLQGLDVGGKKEVTIMFASKSSFAYNNAFLNDLNNGVQSFLNDQRIPYNSLEIVRPMVPEKELRPNTWYRGVIKCIVPMEFLISWIQYISEY